MKSCEYDTSIAACKSMHERDLVIGNVVNVNLQSVPQAERVTRSRC